MLLECFFRAGSSSSRVVLLLFIVGAMVFEVHARNIVFLLVRSIVVGAVYIYAPSQSKNMG